MATQGDVTRRVMILHRVMQRPDESHAVHDLRGARQPFADLDAVGAGTDWFVRTTDLFGRIGFHVERVDMTGPAPLEEENDRFNPRLRSLGLRSLRLLG